MKNALPARRDRRVKLGQDPRRGALKQGEALDQGRDVRHKLDGGGARANYRHPLAAQVIAMVPARGVEVHASKSVQALDGWQHRHVHGAASHHHKLRPIDAGAGVQAPELLRVYPARLQQLVLQAQAVHHAKLFGGAPRVVFDLALLGEKPAPARVGGERVGIQGRGHVAAAAGVVVVAPDAANFAAFFQQQKIDARLAQLDGRANASKTRAHHDDRVSRLSGRSGIGAIGVIYGRRLRRGVGHGHVGGES